jgi:hypothetical protein
MKVSPGQAQGTPVEAPTLLTKPERSGSAPTTSEAASKTENQTPVTATSNATPSVRQTNVTLRRDTNGRVYYVVSDAKSGQEIIEVPPKALRDVSQGIEDYLKAEESKASTHVEVKA